MTIDISNMKALAAKLRDEYEARISITSSRYCDAISKVPLQAANAIDSLLSELEAREADRRRHALELEGVIIDTEQGHGFDEICLATIKRVQAALAQRQGEEK